MMVKYPASSAYKMQFEGIMATSMNKVMARHGLLQFFFLHGCFCKIGFGLPTGFSEGGGQIAKNADFAIKIKNWQLTFSSSAGSPLEFGLSF
jgi:hypothetical protein